MYITRYLFEYSPFADNPDIQHGTPVGIQIVGRKFNEEKLIEIAELFEEALKDLGE